MNIQYLKLTSHTQQNSRVLYFVNGYSVRIFAILIVRDFLASFLCNVYKGKFENEKFADKNSLRNFHIQSSKDTPVIVT